MRRRAQALLVLMSAAGCEAPSVIYTPVRASPVSLVPVRPNRVLMLRTFPRWPHVEIAVLTVSDEMASDQKMRRALQERAGKEGCQALVVSETEQLGVGPGVLAGGIGLTTIDGLRASCVVFTRALPRQDSGAAGALPEVKDE